jgi:hypothetical protein
MPSLGFRTRKHGSPKQIGRKFPIMEKKKLPPRISMPSPKNKVSGISNVSFTAPISDRDGKISFVFDGTRINNSIRIVQKDERVGQWDLLGNILYVDDDLPSKWLKYIAVHESVEAYLSKKYKLNPDAEAHTLAEDIEHRFFLQQGHLENEWAQYSKTCKFVSKLNAGGKVSRKVNLQRAYDLLARKRKQLNWQERGLNSIVQKQSQSIENQEFGEHLRKTIDRHRGVT